VEACDDIGNDVVRVLGRPTIQAGMQVAACCLHDDLVTDHAAQHDADGRRFGVPHSRVAHEREIAGQLVLVGLKEWIEGRRPRFFLALEQDCHVDRQVTGLFDIGARCLDEGHQLTFVVGRPARDNDLAAVSPCFDGRLEGILVPQFQRIDGLDVVMAVKEDMGSGFAGLAMANDHRVAFRIAHRCIYTDRGQFAREPLGSLAARSRILGIGGNALDLEKVKQSIEAGVEIGLDARQDLVDGTHNGSLILELVGKAGNASPFGRP